MTTYLTADQIRVLAEHHDLVVPIPEAVYIAGNVSFNGGVTLHPGSVLIAEAGSHVSLGARTVVWPQSFVRAVDGATITVGEESEIGPGGARLLASGEQTLRIGDFCCVRNGAEILGNSYLGRGACVFGALSAQNVNLEDGLGGSAWPVADERGPVIKGIGVARGLHLTQGQVVNGFPDLTSLPVEMQSLYHPEAKAK